MALAAAVALAIAALSSRDSDSFSYSLGPPAIKICHYSEDLIRNNITIIKETN